MSKETICLSDIFVLYVVKQENKMIKFSLGTIFSRFKSKILFTWSLVLLEALVFLLYPLFIGDAVDGLINNDKTGLLLFAGLGIVHLLFAGGRRFYDTRIYSKIYLQIAPELVEKEFGQNSEASKVSARTNMLTELIEFLENIFPEIVNSLIGLIGTMVLLLLINLNIFIATLISIAVTVIVYALSSKRTFRLNSSFNSELERHYDIIKKREMPGIFNHFKKLTFFNIKLSDLETINFSIIWAGFIGLIIYSIIAVVHTEQISYGEMLSTIMYVFNFVESMIMMPFFYQQYVRLQEITDRISS